MLISRHIMWRLLWVLHLTRAASGISGVGKNGCFGRLIPWARACVEFLRCLLRAVYWRRTTSKCGIDGIRNLIGKSMERKPRLNKPPPKLQSLGLLWRVLRNEPPRVHTRNFSRPCPWCAPGKCEKATRFRTDTNGSSPSNPLTSLELPHSCLVKSTLCLAWIPFSIMG